LLSRTPLFPTGQQSVGLPRRQSESDVKTGIGVRSVATAIALLMSLGPTVAAQAQPARLTASDTEAERLERVASFERNGPSGDPAYLDALTSLSLLYVNQGRYSEAVPVLRRALVASERVHGPGHELTRQVRGTLTLAERFANSR
jgi:hypothetical protein